MPRSISLTRGFAVVVVGEHQVVRRDVAVDERLAVQVAERAQRLVRDLERQRDRRGLGLAGDSSSLTPSMYSMTM